MTIAVLGAISLLGQEIITCIEESEITDIQCVEFENGEELECSFRGDTLGIDTFDEIALGSRDTLIIASLDGLTGSVGDFKKKVEERFNKCVVLDCTNSFEGFPLLASADAIQAPALYRMPSSNAAHLHKFISLIGKLEPVKSLILTSFEPVSSAGQVAVDELWQQGLAIYNSSEVPVETFPYQLAFSLIPQVGVLNQDGTTSAERATAEELHGLCGLESSACSITMVRVPAYFGSGHSLSFTLGNDLELTALIDLIKSDEQFEFYDADALCPSTLQITQSLTMLAGKLRKTGQGSYSVWLVADNLPHIASAVVSVLTASS